MRALKRFIPYFILMLIFYVVASFLREFVLVVLAGIVLVAGHVHAFKTWNDEL